MKEIGLAVAPQLTVEGDHSLEGGRKAMATLLKGQPRPTAIVCSNDMTAIGVMRQSYEEKISIPRDLSVIGFDDIRLAQFILPPLTTVQMSQSELARLAFHALLSEVHGTEYMLETNLILRESTAMAASLAT
jgi:DNA-binding LacI/PurR family transcriptional regulator